MHIKYSKKGVVMGLSMLFVKTLSMVISMTYSKIMATIINKQ